LLKEFDLKELLEIGYLVDRINGKSALFWYFYWRQTAILMNGPATDSQAEKFEILSFWLTKRVEDPSEEFILDKIERFWDLFMTEKKTFESENRTLDITYLAKLALYMVETGALEIVKPQPEGRFFFLKQ
jgi:hypothetical protein